MEKTQASLCNQVQNHASWEFGDKVVISHYYVESHPDPEVWVLRATLNEPQVPSEEMWFVVGEIPPLSFNMAEISTAEEALAMWAWFVRRWMLFKGMRKPDLHGELLDLRHPESGRPMTMAPADKAWMNLRLNRVLYRQLPSLSSRIHHPEIRRRLKLMGVKVSEPGHDDADPRRDETS